MGKYPSRAKWGIQISIHWTTNGPVSCQIYPRPHVILDDFSVGMGKTEEGVGENLLNLVFIGGVLPRLILAIDEELLTYELDFVPHLMGYRDFN